METTELRKLYREIGMKRSELNEQSREIRSEQTEPRGEIMKSRSRTVMIAVAGIVLVAAVLLIMSRPSQADAAKVEFRATPVEVTPASVSTIEEIISAVGSVEAMRDVVVSSETAGRGIAVKVNVGDPVTKGQTLVQVDAELKEVAVQQARAQLLAAKTSMEKAKKDYERTETLYASGDVADIELEGYRLASHSAEAQYQSALAGLRYAERQLADTRIVSPINGLVASRKVEVGEMVAPGREVANIVDVATVKVKLSIPEEDVVKLRPGQKATLRLDSHPGSAFEGKVYTISAKSENPNGHAYPVEIAVQNKNGTPLKVGMYARVGIQANSAKGAVSVSKEALVEEDGTMSVFVAQNGVARLRPVKLGLQGGSLVQVLEGVNDGELVVTFGHRALKDGMPVAIKGQ